MFSDLQKILMILFLMAGIGICAYLVGNKEKEITATIIEESEWCLHKQIPYGGSFGENGPGEYEYQLIATTNGIDVYRKCAQ